MQEMVIIPRQEEGGVIFIYSEDRKHYEFHSQGKINKTDTYATVEFKTSCYEAKRKNTVLGNFQSLYTAEVLEDNNTYTNNYDPEGNLLKYIKVHWNAHFCENSFELVRGDIFQEADLLKKSFERLTNLAEFTYGKQKVDVVENNLLETYERKKLKKAFSTDQFDHN